MHIISCVPHSHNHSGSPCVLINIGGVPDRFCIFPTEESYMYMCIRSLKQLLADHWLVWPHHNFYHVHVYTATGYKAFVFHTQKNVYTKI